MQAIRRPALASRLAANIGRGLAAGVVGTAAMTVSSTLEARARGRDASTTPADALEKALGVRANSDQHRQRLNSIAHWSYGTTWGAARGVIASTPLNPAAATAAHLGMVWAAEQAVLPGLGVAEPATKWPAKEIAIDFLHHAVYAVSAGLAFIWLCRASSDA